MTKISKKLISWLLGVFACVAVAFGIMVARPQTKTASAAETAVTFGSATLGDAKHDTYGTSIRFDTTEATFALTTYYNWVSAADYVSIADYTTVNGRTVTEINNANPDKQPITLMMQNTGTFSFLRLYIPAEIMSLGDVKSMGILDGWSFTDSKNDGTTYTASATTFLRNGDTMALASSYTALPIVTPTVSTAASGYRIGETLGGDSWVVSIDLGTDAVYEEYDLMYDGYKNLRNAIYINGKSMEEWNTQAIADNPALGEPSTYLVFPQNSTEAGHLSWFVKPIGLWGNNTDDVVKLTIHKSLVADAEEIVVKVGAGAYVSGQFMVGETVSTTVHTQTPQNVTENIACMTNAIKEDQGYALYFIYTGNSTSYWTKEAMAGGCLGEDDITGGLGGQSLLKYIYFNGTSLWDINKAVDGAYDSTHGNIVNGGVYAPIFATLSYEVGGAIKLCVPLHFAGLDENGVGINDATSAVQDNHREIVLKRGLSIYDSTTGYSSYVTNDIVFTNTTEGAAGNTRWTKETKGNEIATEVTGIKTYANRTDSGNNENFVIFQLSNNDYAGLNTIAITDISSLYGYIDIGGTMLESYSGEKYFNVWGVANSIAFRFENYETLREVPYITIKAGAKFPSYNAQNGGALTYYVTSEDITFIHDVPNDTWTVGEQSTAEETVDTSVSSIIVPTAKLLAIKLTTDNYTDYTEADSSITLDASSLNGYILLGDTALDMSSLSDTYIEGTGDVTYPGYFVLYSSSGVFSGIESVTIKAGAKFPAYNSENTYYVTEEDITFVKDGNTWVDESTLPKEITASELAFVHQTQETIGTETYLIKTSNAYWTKAPQGNNLNESDSGDEGGQEQMKYIYFNGTSLYDINKNDNGSYGSTNSSISGGNGIYAPILVRMGLDVTYSYIQLHVPTCFNGKGDGSEGATANENHQSVELKAGFTVTEDGVTYTVTEDVKWLNLNGSWVKADATFAADTVTIGNPRKEGSANELYKVDITSTSWNITCNDYDFMYGGSYATYRQYIFINGVSVYDINTNTDDSAYTYSTGPMTGNDDSLFAHPVLIETHYQSGDSNTITLWIHKNYIESLSGDITVTLGAGFAAFTGGLALLENVDYTLTATVTVDGTDHTVVKGNTFTRPNNPTKDMTETTIYTFDNWYIVGTDTAYDFSTVVTEDIAIEARYTETEIVLKETEVTDIYYSINATNDSDRWLIFYLSEHDYPEDTDTYSVPYTEIQRLGLLERIIIRGSISVGGTEKTEATFAEICAANGYGEAIYLNIWDTITYRGTLAFRARGVSTISQVVVEEGAFFPSYAYISGSSTEDVRYTVMRTTTYEHTQEDGLDGNVIPLTGYEYDIQMEDGASVRIGEIDEKYEDDEAWMNSEGYKVSGIRFQTKIALTDIEKLQAALDDGTYKKVTFGTLIVPTSQLMGGSFTHAWLNANGVTYMDIASTAGFYDNEGVRLSTPVWADEDGGYVSYYGSIVQLKSKNHDRYFSGVGYIKIVTSEEETVYVYAPYHSANSRSASFVANAAINDRSATEVEGEYENPTENNNFSPYTDNQRAFLDKYIKWSDSALSGQQDLSVLAEKGGTATITPTDTALAGAYVKLIYKTNVNVWGVFTYTDGTKTANEDFYLQAGTTEHKQYLDIFRYNGVGYGMNTANLSMTSIKFTNAELMQEKTGQVQIFGLYSESKTIDMDNQEIYVTKTQKDGSEMTVGAHLGLGGSFTYLAKSGVYEGVVGQEGHEEWKQNYLGYTQYKYNTGSVALSTDTSEFDASHATGNKTSEAGYYGHATSSKAADGAVNLINNFDAGRQIQQSWYAQVGNEDGTENNGYTRANCTTGATAEKPSQYWPYNPVQAGDVVSNPSQIIDYEVTADYIYVKARAMDWAKGKGSDNLAGTVDGGSTTKSYVENYYRLNDDGTVVVNNSFVDWNGFTDMGTCDWASTELPAVYPIQSLNYYVSNIDGDGTWEDGLDNNNTLSSWVTNAYVQFANPAEGEKSKVEDWFAWANGGDGNAFGLGMYIPNVDRFTSGRSTTTTALSSEYNRNALSNNLLLSKDLMSNMQSIDLTYKSAYVSNTSYTAPGVNYRMEAYVPIEYSYVICVGSVNSIRETFKGIKDNGTVTNAGEDGRYEKVGLDAWARADKKWTW